MNEERKKSGKVTRDHLRYEIAGYFKALQEMDEYDNDFFGVMYTDRDEAGNEVAVCGNITFRNEGMIWCRGTDSISFRKNIDGMVQLRLSYPLHEKAGPTGLICNHRFFYN